MRIYTSQLFFGAGDNPDDAEAKWAMEHLPKDVFAKAANVPLEDVRHVYSELEAVEPDTDPDICWWSETPEGDLTMPVTVAFLR